MKANVYLNIEGAQARKAREIGFLGKAGIEQSGFGQFVRLKEELQAKPAESFSVAAVTLPEWDGDLKERAAVGLGMRKKFARFIERVEIIS